MSSMEQLTKSSPLQLDSKVDDNCNTFEQKNNDADSPSVDSVENLDDQHRVFNKKTRLDAEIRLAVGQSQPLGKKCNKIHINEVRSVEQTLTVTSGSTGESSFDSACSSDSFHEKHTLKTHISSERRDGHKDQSVLSFSNDHRERNSEIIVSSMNPVEGMIIDDSQIELVGKMSPSSSTLSSKPVSSSTCGDSFKIGSKSSRVMPADYDVNSEAIPYQISSTGAPINLQKSEKSSQLPSFTLASTHDTIKETMKQSHSTHPKCIRMKQLREKYMSEIDYMLREFKKLERQLLGAKTAMNGAEESTGSRERREKLHAFILHLEDTIKQIETGCTLETDLKESPGVAVDGDNEVDGEPIKRFERSTDDEKVPSESTLTSFPDKIHDDVICKLEEHIVSNLLPVKVRLSKQLAAQLGSSKNPAGMPPSRRGIPTIAQLEKTTGTFAAAAERKRMAEVSGDNDEDFSAQTSLFSTPLHTASSVAVGSGHPSSFGEPLAGGGSSLTQKLHGETLGSKARCQGQGVGNNNSLLDPTGMICLRNRLIAGIAPGSDKSQVRSTISSATTAHGDMFDNRNLNLNSSTPESTANIDDTTPSSLLRNIENTVTPIPERTKSSPFKSQNSIGVPSSTVEISETTTHQCDVSSGCNTMELPPLLSKNQAHDNVPTHLISMTVTTRSPKKSLKHPGLTLDERAEIIKRKLKKRKQRLLNQQGLPEHQNLLSTPQPNHLTLDNVATSTSVSTTKTAKLSSTAMTRANGNKNGGKNVEYICAMCNEIYIATCDANPWWSLVSHECPKCCKTQIPRIDISSPANEIDYHPALLVQAAEDNATVSSVGKSNVLDSLQATAHLNLKTVPDTTAGNSVTRSIKSALNSVAVADRFSIAANGSSSDSDLDFSQIDECELSSSDSDSSSTCADKIENMSLTTIAENEDFGKEYSGPTFADYDSSRLLILMSHASTCPGLHKKKETRDVCRSTKLLMLHVRDCPGTLSSSDVCPFPWCRKTKHLLYHLVSCNNPQTCIVCSHRDISPNLRFLHRLNQHRIERKLNSSHLTNEKHKDVTPRTIVASDSTLVKKANAAGNELMLRLQEGKHPNISTNSSSTSCKKYQLITPNPLASLRQLSNKPHVSNSTTDRNIVLPEKRFTAASTIMSVNGNQTYIPSIVTKSSIQCQKKPIKQDDFRTVALYTAVATDVNRKTDIDDCIFQVKGGL